MPSSREYLDFVLEQLSGLEDISYDGAKEMLLVEEVEDKDFLRDLLEAMYDELPATKEKK
ncbi:MAG: hypothetical protein J5747_06295 [Spirochaetaceae bacterium]|nr:hypothetical protein [Spirochaetaceae bacterium]